METSVLEELISTEGDLEKLATDFAVIKAMKE